MTGDGSDILAPAIAADDGREVTAKLTRDELVRGWRERAARAPRCVPVVRFGLKTDLGRVRENNEDKADFYEPDDPTLLAARGSLYAVADGMGGHAAGQIASEVALKTFIASYYDSPTDDIPTALLEAASAANEQVHGIAATVAAREGMGTTLTAAVLAEDRVYVTQVGDSRAYLIRDDEVRQVTNDHSWVAEQVRMGGLTPDEAESHPYRNIITRSIGTQARVEADVFIETVHEGDTWVLCSDGLTGHVSGDEISEVTSGQSPSEAARRLVDLANARGGRDNITVIVLRVLSVEGDASRPEPEPTQDEAPADRVDAAVPGPAAEPVEPRKGLRRLLGKRS